LPDGPPNKGDFESEVLNGVFTAAIYVGTDLLSLRLAIAD